MSLRACLAIETFAFCGIVGCGAVSGPPAGPAVADPGGPFTTSLASNRWIDGLTIGERDTLCRDLAAAYYSFLRGAVEMADFCRKTVTETASEALRLSDGGLDAGGFCSTAYEQCLRGVPPTSRFFCPLPISSSLPHRCDATVEDVSACLNEIAANDPIGTCVKTPGCDGDAAADAQAPSSSAMPACDRLSHICSDLGAIATFPC